MFSLNWQVDEKWGASSWAKRLQMKSKRAALTDLDRFSHA